ncbi:hypothetical protein CANCADRAFT_99507 [Tortispora caseinolytica NRRL Y-17796]|uniref:Zn(2)-C6 fungal-type domain-containing protein n=1 Tax=Tortispora caseinolytica NRRL Y-17796 TaxID=767744 RepID=A0A1E4TE14_9ASCO|nr:hypothetical protein CANCADRAFT_99507 [Tortispora caseinolytica NRRL Y-17796]
MSSQPNSLSRNNQSESPSYIEKTSRKKYFQCQRVRGGYRKSCNLCRHLKVRCIFEEGMQHCTLCSKRGSACVIEYRKSRTPSKKQTNISNVSNPISSSSRLADYNTREQSKEASTFQPPDSAADNEYSYHSSVSRNSRFTYGSHAHDDMYIYTSSFGHDPKVATRMAQLYDGRIDVGLPSTAMNAVGRRKFPFGAVPPYPRDSPLHPIFSNADLPIWPDYLVEWIKEYGTMLLETFFKVVNPHLPIICCSEFNLLYAHKQVSAALLISLFAAAVSYCPNIPVEQRFILRRDFMNALMRDHWHSLSLHNLDNIQALMLASSACHDRASGNLLFMALSMADALKLFINPEKLRLDDYGRATRKCITSSLKILVEIYIAIYCEKPIINVDYICPVTPSLQDIILVISSERSSNVTALNIQQQTIEAAKSHLFYVKLGEFWYWCLLNSTPTNYLSFSFGSASGPSEIDKARRLQLERDQRLQELSTMLSTIQIGSVDWAFGRFNLEMSKLIGLGRFGKYESNDPIHDFISPEYAEAYSSSVFFMIESYDTILSYSVVEMYWWPPSTVYAWKSLLAAFASLYENFPALIQRTSFAEYESKMLSFLSKEVPWYSENGVKSGRRNHIEQFRNFIIGKAKIVLPDGDIIYPSNAANPSENIMVTKLGNGFSKSGSVEQSASTDITPDDSGSRGSVHDDQKADIERVWNDMLYFPGDDTHDFESLFAP